MIAVGVSGLLTTVVLPPMIGLFESLGADLPLATKFVVAVASFIIDNKFYILAALIGFPIVVAVCGNAPSVRYIIDRLLLHIPLVGQAILRTNLFHFCRTSAMLLEAGMQIPNALAICIRTVANSRIRAALTEGEMRLSRGQTFSQAMAATGVFHSSSIEALVVGEQIGDLESALKNIAGHYERTSTERMDSLVSMIEPALTVVIGLGVGLIAVSIISPMYSLPGSLP
ncbi:MAG: type II secretion system F family protein [Dehalococcoidales bacterium]|nr:type II secretion system F family protein [Dehalococcoidales bacterium]